MATAAQIDAAVQTLLRHGDATTVYSMAYGNQSNRLPLVQAAGVIPKLVELVCRGTGNQNYALLALWQLTRCKLVEAQDAIADAHEGAIFTWLVGAQDHGCPDQKQHLLTQLTSNHPVNQARLAVARGDFKPLVELIKTSVASGNSTAIAKATSMVSTFAKPEQLASFSQLGGVAVLEMVINWIPNVWDEHCFKAQENAFVALTKFQGIKDLPESPKALIRALQQNTTGDIDGSARKCCVLYKLTVMSETEALAIVQDGGVAALVTILTSEALGGKDGQHVSEGLWRYAARLLTKLLRAESSTAKAMSHVDLEHVVTRLVRMRHSHSNSSSQSVAVDALCVIVQDEKPAMRIARIYGVPYLVDLLFRCSQNGANDACMVMVLERLLLTSNANQIAFASCGDDAMAMLVALTKSVEADTRVRGQKLLSHLPGLIPLLLPLLELEDTLFKRVWAVEALEWLSSNPQNHAMFAECGGVESIVSLFKKTTEHNEAKVAAVRILANLSSNNDDNRVVAAKCGVIPLLTGLVTSAATTSGSATTVTTSNKLTTVALMALRNLASNDANSALIGALGVIPCVIAMAQDVKTPRKQREIAVALLGNLARLPANQTVIVFHDGITALVQSIQCESTRTVKLVETVAMALFVLVHHSAEDRQLLVDASGAEVIKKAIQKIPPQQHEGPTPWTMRLLGALL